MVRATIEITLSEAEVQPATLPRIATLQAPRNDGEWAGSAAGGSPAAGGLGVSPRELLFLPPSSQEGARGMVRATTETTLSEPEVQPATPPQIATLQAPRNDGTYEQGVQRGVAPLPGGWGCPPESFNFFPLPPRKGARGMVRATTEITLSEAEVQPAIPPRIATLQAPRNDGTYEQGVQRGVAPLPGVWGCPPESFNFFPLPPRKGVRGMVRATIETTLSEAEVQHATLPRIATLQAPRNDGTYEQGVQMGVAPLPGV